MFREISVSEIFIEMPKTPQMDLFIITEDNYDSIFWLNALSLSIGQ